ncbi:glycogen debranching N-terminal domain-containing protein [Streptomyces chrestomyceticus]|uniref:glycogen debranching N-terminal domain-containing protein n=1 Tax=Streptomyces chrestomyceticus TaxID=68185 RepID=UPI003F4CBE82
MVPTTQPARRAPGDHRSGVPRPPEPQPVHRTLICVALPALAISSDQGQLTGRGTDGFYRAGRRVLSRCQLSAGGAEPVIVQGRLIASDRARFVGTVRTAVDRGPDPEMRVERLRSADGVERITFHSSAPRRVRLPVELRLGTDLADLGAIAVGVAGPELPASVHGSGLRWSAAGTHAVIAATPAPTDVMASAGLLCWELDLPPGGQHTIEVRVRLEHATSGAFAGRPGPPLPATRGSEQPPRPWSAARLQCDDPRADALLAAGLDDLHGLLMRGPGAPTDTYIAGGVPWRCGLSPAEALWAARMLLPLGTRLAANTLRTLAHVQLAGAGADSGRIPGALRDAGPYAPPSCTGVEATLLFPAVLAEARRWGLPDRDTEQLLPAAESCLKWLRTTVGDDGSVPGDGALGGGSGYVPDPAPGGPYRCATQAHAHRAALLGADLLDACGRPGAPALREWAAGLRSRFREEFWVESRSGGSPAVLRTPGGRLLPHFGSAAVHLLDTGLVGGGRTAVGLLDAVRTERLARLLGSPAMDSGWGLRGLGAKESGYNPFGHRSGAVRVHETAVAVAGLAAAGHEKEAASLVRGLLDAAQSFAYRLPEMYAGEQRTRDGAPVPHPAACRPAAVAAAGAVHALTALAGVRPDVPAGTVAVRPVGSAPLGAMQFTGLSVAGQPFAVRISRLGLGLVEEAANGLQLGA